jgi:hypothetical protein
LDPVADVAGDALLAGDLDQPGDEAVVARVVDRRGETHDGRADAAFGEPQHRPRAGFPAGAPEAAAPLAAVAEALQAVSARFAERREFAQRRQT